MLIVLKIKILEVKFVVNKNYKINLIYIIYNLLLILMLKFVLKIVQKKREFQYVYMKVTVKH